MSSVTNPSALPLRSIIYVSPQSNLRDSSDQAPVDDQISACYAAYCVLKPDKWHERPGRTQVSFYERGGTSIRNFRSYTIEPSCSVRWARKVAQASGANRKRTAECSKRGPKCLRKRKISESVNPAGFQEMPRPASISHHTLTSCQVPSTLRKFPAYGYSISRR